MLPVRSGGRPASSGPGTRLLTARKAPQYFPMTVCSPWTKSARLIPRMSARSSYALGNGAGKQRASRTGAARPVARWRCILLSSGELTVGTIMAEAGHRIKAGQSVRLLDVPAARRFGCFDELHGFSSGAALSDAIKRAAGLHYGWAGRAFLERLTHDQQNFAELLERFKALPAFNPPDAEG